MPPRVGAAFVVSEPILRLPRLSAGRRVEDLSRRLPLSHAGGRP
jgi:hypothetical protein